MPRTALKLGYTKNVYIFEQFNLKRSGRGRAWRGINFINPFLCLFVCCVEIEAKWNNRRQA